jgi:hypothetical protein
MARFLVGTSMYLFHDLDEHQEEHKDEQNDLETLRKEMTESRLADTNRFSVVKMDVLFYCRDKDHDRDKGRERERDRDWEADADKDQDGQYGGNSGGNGGRRSGRSRSSASPQHQTAR